MVNKKEKSEGTKTKAADATPKSRVVTKPKPAARAAGGLAKSAPAKTKIAKAPVAAGVRQDDIAVRAYLIAEKRQQLGLPGDSLGDWVEAERQLLSERGANGAN